MGMWCLHRRLLPVISSPLPIPSQLWREYCRFRELYPTCQVILHQHQGHVTKIECRVVIRAQPEPLSREESLYVIADGNSFT